MHYQCTFYFSITTINLIFDFLVPSWLKRRFLQFTELMQINKNLLWKEFLRHWSNQSYKLHEEVGLHYMYK